MVDIFGSAETVTLTSVSRQAITPMLEAAAAPTAVSQDSLELSMPVDGRSTAENRLQQKDAKPTHLETNKENKELQTVNIPGNISNSADKDTSAFQFHENHGKNINLSSDRSVASRSESYNQGIVMSARTLSRNSVFQV